MLDDFKLAERVAQAARDLGIQTALIGASALAFHNYVRATADTDLASAVDPFTQLTKLQSALEASGLQTKLFTPDEEDMLGGKLQVWEQVDDEEEPVEPIDVVNFLNPWRPRRNPGAAAIAGAVAVEEGSPLRCVSLPYLVALKLYAAGDSDRADIVALLRRNPDADRAAIVTICKGFGLDEIDALLVKVDSGTR